MEKKFGKKITRKEKESNFKKGKKNSSHQKYRDEDDYFQEDNYDEENKE
jgi:hypothetical protein